MGRKIESLSVDGPAGTLLRVRQGSYIFPNKQSLRLIGILAAVILMGWLVFDLTLPKEPLYGRRTLTQWLEPDTSHEPRKNASKLGFLFNQSFTTRFELDSPVARRAIAAIGTNAIPPLLRMIQARDSSLKLRLNSLLDHQRIIRFRFRSGPKPRALALLGFEVLRETAKPAVSVLASLTNDPDAGVRYVALQSLRHVTSDKNLLVPLLLQACRDSSPEIRFIATTDLHFRCPEELEKAGIPDPILALGNQTTDNVETNVPELKN